MSAGVADAMLVPSTSPVSSHCLALDIIYMTRFQELEAETLTQGLYQDVKTYRVNQKEEQKKGISASSRFGRNFYLP